MDGALLVEQFSGRLTILCGPFGVGKSEIAIGLSEYLAFAGRDVCLVDLDVVTPYFRPRDVSERLAESGIRLVSPPGEAAFLDLPAVPGGIYETLSRGARGEASVVVDLGGRADGAQVLASVRDALTQGPHWDMLFVLNPYRPDSASVEVARSVLRGVEEASQARVTGLVANPHLKQATTTDDLVRGFARVESAAEALGLPIRLRCVPAGMAAPVATGLVLPLRLALLLPFESAPVGAPCGARPGAQGAP